MRHDSEPQAIEVRDLWVRYRSSYEHKPTVRKALVRLGRRQRTVHIVEAVRGVSFSVGDGTVLGIVGTNGAGKTTLLRAIAGIIPPSRGAVTVRGKMATLLALGVGFKRELSGRDNVLLAGLAYGLSADEIHARFPAILEFSELGAEIDAQVRTYSRGMIGRLGFAIAAHLDSEILLIDEALSAGDAAFREKCGDRMRELTQAHNRTVLIVSHGLGVIKDLAQNVLWLDEGQTMQFGPADEVVDAYARHKKLKRKDAAMEDA